MAIVSIKVVPGARKNQVVGKYGDAIKIQVSAPPEQGKANQAVIATLAEALDIKPHQLRIVRGHSQSRKIVEIEGIDACEIQRRLTL